MVKVLRSLLTVLLTVLLLLSAIAPAFAADDPMAQYTDLKKDWSYNSIRWCVENGIMVGTSKTQFSPAGVVTRSQFITALCRIAEKLGYNMNGYVCTSQFHDVKKNQWFAKQVTWGYRNGLVMGISTHMFGPDDPITRQDMAVMLDRFLTEYLLYDKIDTSAVPSYADQKKIAKYARAAALDLASVGLMSGSAGKFMPVKTTTRAEMASVLQRLDAFVNGEDVISPFARVKIGINYYTYEGLVTMRPDNQENREYMERTFGTLYDSGIDHIRLQVEPLTVEFHDNYEIGDDGLYHLCFFPGVMEQVRTACDVATNLGMSVIIDLHRYLSLPNMILHYDEYLPVLRERLEANLQKEKDRINAAIPDPDAPEDVIEQGERDLELFDQLEQMFAEDPEAATEWLFDGRLCKRFSSFYGLNDDFEQLITEPSGEERLWGEVWAKFADELQDCGPNVFFQLVNERDLTHEDEMTAIRAIRSGPGEYNKERMIVCYTYCWDFFNAITGEPKNDTREEWDFEEYNSDPNIMFDMHLYCPATYTHNRSGYTWISDEEAEAKGKAAVRVRDRYISEITSRLDAAKDLEERTGRHVWIGEHGCYLDTRGRPAYFADLNTQLAKYHLPVCYWASHTTEYRESSDFWCFFAEDNRWHEETRYLIFN